MMKRLITLMVALVSLIAVSATENKIETYSAPEGAELIDEYKVEVSNGDGQWIAIPTYAEKVAKVDNGRTSVKQVSMAYFDFSGEAHVRIVKLKGDFAKARIRPDSRSIGYKRIDHGIEFCLSKPDNLSIEFDGDIYNNVHLFANPIDTNRPKRKKGKDIVYFAPGIHRLPGDTLFVKSGQTVYVAGGAIIKGAIWVKNAHDVNIYGRGEIRPQGRGEGIYIANSERVKVEGVIVSQCPVGGSNDVEITNVKAISSYGWGDGLNVFASSNVKWNGVFCRTSDDCTTVYATRKGFTGGCKKISMTNSTLWADVAHPIFIGLHGNVEHPDTIENVSYDNIDILDQNEMQIDYQGCMAINVGDNNLVRDISFSNIRVESIRRGQLLSLRICFNKKYCLAPGRGIENVSFKNICYNGTLPEMSIIAGYDGERRIKNVTFDNLSINGTHISDTMEGKPKWYKTADMARIYVGEHVEGVKFE